MRKTFASYCTFIGELMGFGHEFLSREGDYRFFTVVITKCKLCRIIPEYC